MKGRARKAMSIERRRKVQAMVLAGVPYDEIASTLGVARSTVQNDVKRLMEDWKKTAQYQIDEARIVELSRMDRLNVAVWRQAVNGDLMAVDKAVKISERRAKMLGLDAAQKMQLEVRIDNPLLLQMVGKALVEVVKEFALAESFLVRFWDILKAMRPSDEALVKQARPALVSGGDVPLDATMASLAETEEVEHGN